MKKSPSGLEYINTIYRQKRGASVQAAYGIVIEYFSRGDYPLSVFFKNYKSYFDIHQPSGLKIEGIISKHFYDYCDRNEKMKLEFVHEFHLSNLFNSRMYCRVALWKANTLPIEPEEVMELRYTLIDGGLVMVIYNISPGHFHCVVLGFDKLYRRFFTRDPAKEEIIFEDFLSHHEITEYILFV